ncbi:MULTISPECIES: hypothetical protein [Actinokineospora]|uniref:Uncharacterized protein n=1 Tax=Actinokineospora fastidiosa TaxID=1816 RepID=A0A918GDP2_9PSEU|nr:MULTISPECIES: hypothetical protein [Actinokineospora]UVS79627.1 hypothetical protein Actkin_03377 [Actinokineospora sp. UTMC 2448]GGS29979.1 hypothetical protein GCM10010171_24220 [Actinokineospora fastidiosa]
MTRKLAVFAALESLAAGMNGCVGGVQGSMDNWRQTSGMTEAEWTDQGGGVFAEISQAFQAAMQAGQELLQAMNQGVMSCQHENMGAVQRSCGRMSA